MGGQGESTVNCERGAVLKCITVKSSTGHTERFLLIDVKMLFMNITQGTMDI